MRISKFMQTPFISYDDKNMAYVTVEDWDACNPFDVIVSVDGESVYQEKVFAKEFSVMIPCFDTECIAELTITPFEDLPVSKQFNLSVPKKWEIPLLYSSHEDLGYCAYVDKLHYECYEYLICAMELCRRYEKFKYMIEHYWWLDAFDTYATQEEKAQLQSLFKEGRMELNALHSGVHTSWSNSEQLVRTMYFPCRDAEKKYGISPKTALYSDISGMSQSVLKAHCNMGIRYMGVFPNGFRNCPENKSIPPLFRWKDKDSDNEVIFWHQRSYRDHEITTVWCDTLRQYPEGKFYFDTTKAVKTEKMLTDRISRLGDCGYNILPLCFYDDREKPTTMLLTVCEEMNRRWKYPEFRMEIPSVFMKDIEKKYKDVLPVIVGDITDQWADFAPAAPHLVSLRRSVSRLLYDSEFLGVRDAVMDGKSYDETAYREASWNMSLFDEHCWPTSSKHPMEMHRYNIDYAKIKPIERSYKALADIICTRGETGAEISIASLIPQGYDGCIRLEQHQKVPVAIKHQILPDSTVITAPMHFNCAEIKKYASTECTAKSRIVNDDVFETGYYVVRINRASKKIESILDKELQKELIDRDSNYELGQFVYLYTEDKILPGNSYEVDKTETIELYEGDVAFVIIRKSKEEQCGATIETQFIFYKNEKNIDVDFKYANLSGLIGDFNDRYKKNFFFAFPFNVEKPVFYSELPAGEKCENTDTSPINASDFTVAQNWVCADGIFDGIALYSRDMPVFHLGKIKYNCFSNVFDEEKGHFFLYAASNRCNNLIYTAIDECKASYRLSILPYIGKHNTVVPMWSNRKEHMPFTVYGATEEQNLVHIDKDNVRLVSLKKAEDNENAVVLRFVETKGKKTSAKVELFFKPEKAKYASNSEYDIKPTQMCDEDIVFNIEPFSYQTIKVYGNFTIEK